MRLIKALTFRDKQHLQQALESFIEAGVTDGGEMLRQLKTIMDEDMRTTHRLYNLKTIRCPKCGKVCRIQFIDELVIDECPMRGGCGWSGVREER